MGSNSYQLKVELVQIETPRNEVDLRNPNQYKAIIHGSLESGNVERVEIDADKLHPRWKKMDRSKTDNFTREMESLYQLDIPIIRNGISVPDYKGLKRILEGY